METLSDKQLGRATLARQMLLERSTITPLKAVEALAGLQAQVPKPPFIGLWTRLVDFRRDALVKLIHQRKLVRTPLMRATIHLVTAKDFATLRPAIQPGLDKAMQSLLRKRLDGVDIDAIVAEAAAWFEDTPRPFNALRGHLESIHAEQDVRAMAYAVRMQLPLVQVPSEATWAYPNTADFTTAASWLGKPLGEGSAEALVRRYLAAFGPASVADAQSWSGVPSLKPAFESQRKKLATFHDERGKELFDLPKAPRPDAKTPAPVRFIPEFDNLVLAHADRRRLIDEEYRPRICTKNLRVLATYLVDGRAAGLWKTEVKRGTARLIMSPFYDVSKRAMKALHAEAKRLLTFCEPDAKAYEVLVGDG